MVRGKAVARTIALSSATPMGDTLKNGQQIQVYAADVRLPGTPCA